MTQNAQLPPKSAIVGFASTPPPQQTFCPHVVAQAERCLQKPSLQPPLSVPIGCAPGTVWGENGCLQPKGGRIFKTKKKSPSLPIFADRSQTWDSRQCIFPFPDPCQWLPLVRSWVTYLQPCDTRQDFTRCHGMGKGRQGIKKYTGCWSSMSTSQDSVIWAPENSHRGPVWIWTEVMRERGISPHPWPAAPQPKIPPTPTSCFKFQHSFGRPSAFSETVSGEEVLLLLKTERA